MASPKKLMTELGRRGQHKVLRGDLALTGTPGAIYTPAEGLGLPAIAFGHGWMTSSKNYRKLFEHLASWGIVVACPDTERGFMPDDNGLARDLTTALEVLTQVRLGSGGISVQPERTGVVGHGFGASAAVLAAAGNGALAAFAALYPAPTGSTILPAARTIRVPSLILAAPGELDTMTSNALPLAREINGEVALRVVPDSTNRGLAQGRSVRGALGDGSNDKKTIKTTKAVLTGFLLHQLTGDKKYEAFSAPDGDLATLVAIDPFNPPEPKQKKGPLALLR